MIKRATLSIITKDYETIHRIHAESLKQWLPGYEHIVKYADDYHDLRSDYPDNFVFAIRPHVVLELFGAGYDQIIFLGSDVVFFSHPQELATSCLTTVVPHITRPTPNVTQVQATGHLNADCVKWINEPETVRFLEWMAETLKTNCKTNLKAGQFFDQLALNCLPFFVRRHWVIYDPTYNVAFYNLSYRSLSKDGDDVPYLVNGRPLTYFHFTGFNPKDPARISKHYGGPKAEGALLELMEWYKKELTHVEDRSTKSS